jgi:hypothetical protein
VVTDVKPMDSMDMKIPSEYFLEDKLICFIKSHPLVRQLSTFSVCVVFGNVYVNIATPNGGYCHMKMKHETIAETKDAITAFLSKVILGIEPAIYFN